MADTNKSVTVRSGSLIRCYCEDCETEFEICLEPKMAEMEYETAKAAGAGVKTVEHCPFCGKKNILEC